MAQSKLKVVELFAGVGGFRLGLEKNDNYKVVITGRRENLLEEIKKSNPDKYLIKVQDVTNLDSCEQLFEEVKSELKTIDLIVYSSGVGTPNYKLEWEKEIPTLNTNILAATKIYGLAYNFFRKQGYGHLVGISSIASIVSLLANTKLLLASSFKGFKRSAIS